MTEPTAQRSNGTPTEKMIMAARAAAARHDVRLPQDFEQRFDVCKRFLDEFLTKPTPKAVSFAERIAQEKGLSIPEETLATAKDLSAWIDMHK